MKHLDSLISKSTLGHDELGNNLQSFEVLIEEAFREINGIKGIEPILKVVSHCEALNIVFDFQRDSIGELVATVNEGKREAVDGKIYIAAKGLMKNEERSEPLGLLAQELCRYAMELLYHNQSKPYNDHQQQFDDSLAQLKKIYLDNHEPSDEFRDAVEKITKLFGVNQEFEEVLQVTKAKQPAEPNISKAFNFPSNQQHAELAARVPYVIVAYNQNQKKLNEIRETYAKLFEFYEGRIVSDLEREYPLMEARQEVKKMNELSGLTASLKNSEITFIPEALNFEFNVDRVSFVTTNCSLLTTQLIYQQLSSKENFESSYIFVKLESLKNEKFFDLTVKALSVCTKPVAIIDCCNESPFEMSNYVDDYKRAKLEQRLVFIQIHETFHRKGAAHFIMTHAWTQLTDEAQNQLLKRQIVFQGAPLQLQDILSADSVAIKLMPLIDFFDGKIQIGNPVKFDDVSFHIERQFAPANGFEINYEELLKVAEKNKVCLLTAEPGIGKTSELKAMAVKLKKLLPSYWIVYIDLKELEITFKRERKISKANKTNDELSRFINEKVLKIMGFEAKVFSSLFNENRVVCLMDGIDEASPGFKQFSLNLIISIEEKTSNRIWISARPHMEDELKNKLNAAVYNLLPLSIYDQKAFLAKAFKAKSIDGPKLEKKMKAIEGFLKTLEENTHTDSSSNPIILECIAEIFENDQDVQLNEINLYTVFECFVNKKISNFMKKINGVEKEPMPSLLTESMNALRFHHRQALRTIFGHTHDEQLIQDCFKDNTQPPYADMARIGFINFLDNNKTLQFFHRMFAEFFVADFLFKKIFLANKFPASEKRNFFTSFFSSKRTMAMFVFFREIWAANSPNCKMIRIFLDNKLKNLLFEKNVTYIKRVEAIILKTFSEQELQGVFRTAVEDGLVNIVHVLSGKSFWGTKEILNGIWIQTKAGQSAGLQSSLLLALEYQSVKFIDQLLTKARGAFENEVFKKAFREIDDSGRNIFHCAAVNRKPGVFKLLLMNLKPTLSQDEVNKLLFAKDKFGKNFMMSVVKKQNIKIFQTVLKLVESHFGRDVALVLITNVDSSGRNAFHYVPRWIRNGKDVETIWTTLKGTFTEDEMRQMFCEIDEFGQTPLTHAVTECDDETFRTFRALFTDIYSTNEQRREAVFHESNEGFTALHYATRNKCKEVFMLIQRAYQRIISQDELKALILRENFEGENILFFSFKGSNGNLATLEVLWSLMNELFDAATLQGLLTKKNYTGKTVVDVIKSDLDFEDKMKIFQMTN